MTSYVCFHIVHAETIKEYQGAQTISYPNRRLLGLVTPWFRYVLF